MYEARRSTGRARALEQAELYAGFVQAFHDHQKLIRAIAPGFF
jgi:hypothetical protein